MLTWPLQLASSYVRTHRAKSNQRRRYRYRTEGD